MSRTNNTRKKSEDRGDDGDPPTVRSIKQTCLENGLKALEFARPSTHDPSDSPLSAAKRGLQKAKGRRDNVVLNEIEELKDLFAASGTANGHHGLQRFYGAVETALAALPADEYSEGRLRILEMLTQQQGAFLEELHHARPGEEDEVFEMMNKRLEHDAELFEHIANPKT